jgi:RNA polymerase sigma-70 factor, ECF subfamily
LSQRIVPGADIPPQADPLHAPLPEPEVAGPPAAEPARAFRAVYEQNFGFVWRCLRSLGVPASLLDDATQDVFLVVHRRIDSCRADVALRTWLFGIVRNVAFNARRSVKRKGGHEPLEEEPPSLQPGPLQHAELAESARFVQRFLEQLSDEKREVFVLTVLEELPVSEVATMVGVPLNTAYSRLRSARLDFQRAHDRAQKAAR